MAWLWETKNKETEIESNLSKIQVTGSGGFFMDSDDIYPNREEAIKTIDELESIVYEYIRQTKENESKQAS